MAKIDPHILIMYSSCGTELFHYQPLLRQGWMPHITFKAIVNLSSNLKAGLVLMSLVFKCDRLTNSIYGI